MACRALPFISLKNNYQFWLILQNRISIPIKRIFVQKIALAPGALNHNYHIIILMVILINMIMSTYLCNSFYSY